MGIIHMKWKAPKRGRIANGKKDTHSERFIVLIIEYMT